MLQKENKFEVTTYEQREIRTTGYKWATQINYKRHILNWIETKGNNKRYVFVSSLKPTKKTVAQINFSGRLRWEIENEGFNDQKNGGYQLNHKFSEVNLHATKNYFQLLQIAHMINQLVVHGQKLKNYLKKKITIKHLWTELIAFLKYGLMDGDYINRLLEKRIQIRLE